MSKDDAIQRVTPGSQIPDYLAKYAETETKATQEMLKEHRVLPRLKLIQAMTDNALKDRVGEGSCILTPGEAMICDKKGNFYFVPVLFYDEWITMSDRKDKVSPMIRARSFDKTSEIAKKAADPKKRMEEYEGGFKMRHIHCLTFPGFLYGEHQLAGQAATLVYSKGEFGNGRTFINAVAMRRTPIWSQVWELNPAFRDRGDKKWYGFDFQPADEPDIKAEEVDFFLAAAKEMKELLDNRRLLVVHDEDEDEDGGVPEIDPTKGAKL